MADYILVNKDQFESDLTIVADSIRAKANITDKLEFPQGMKEAVENIQSGGSVEDLFQYATNLDFLFNSATFPDGYELVLNVPNFTENANRICRYAKGLKKVTLKGNTSNNTASLQYGFQQFSNNTLLEEVDFSEWGNGGINVSYLNSTFAGCAKLHTIKGVFDFTNAVNVGNTFETCTALVNVSFKENTLSKAFSFVHSPRLSDDSIQSIINGLVTVETAQTLILHADVKAKLTEAQLTQITSKNWTLA